MELVQVLGVLLVVGEFGEQPEGTGVLHLSDVVVGQFDCRPFRFGSNDFAAWRGPFEFPRSGLPNGPGAVGFQPVVTPAEAGEVRLDRQTAVLGAVAVERGRVVDVAEPC